MKASSTDRIVVRRARHTRRPVSRGGAWKIAYADYMTAMMAFFLIMWILSLVPKEQLGGIAEYFRTPLLSAITGTKKTGPHDAARESGSLTPIPGGASGPASSSPIAPSLPGPAAPQLIPDKDPAVQRDIRQLNNLKATIEGLIRDNPVLRQFQPQLLLDMTPEGLRIQIVDQQQRPMFATGRAQIQPYMRDILRELGPVFNDLPNALTIAGHTDAVQYLTGERLYSNWELSADRANAARQELVAGGMNESKIKWVVGLSSTVSLVKEDPNAAVNRRISLLVLTQAAEHQIDLHNAFGGSAFQLSSAPAR